MKYLFLSIILVIVFARMSCSKNPNEGKLFPIEVQRSVIGITGKESSSPYIEIFYTRKKTDTSNEVVHEWIKPPYLFGDVPVISHIRKICFNNGYSKSCREDPYFTFTELGDSYLHIINHSNNPIEMFLAVNFAIKLYDKNGDYGNICKECNNNNYLYRYPMPLYQKAPIYYLLYPDRTPNLTGLNVLEDNCCKVRNLSYTSTRVGDITLTRAWTVEEVMKLYRAEYRQSSDTILYQSYYYPESRISNNIENNSIYDYKYNVYRPSQMDGFYKKIDGLDSFVSEKEKWYPMTNAIDDARDY